ncbi:hypothetical protein SAMN05421736_101122 [Evansella caseinilytica]|uniref:Uncharacterized protein n=1 Tax=Evansella caseinilytica TaxID=1503961 RepID=A0A1H3GBD4_9BACI|nr:hypothetical protein [Evansella caseinilytica]SDY00581.1 hypothetical protein SAMN05421736_101122 [Evansella caseinilytica]
MKENMHWEDRHHREEHYRRRDGGHKRKEHHRGAKTFRRGRAIEFLDRMQVKRQTLKQQLESPELQSINPVLVGELKAVEMVIDEFVQLFEIHEEEMKQVSIDEKKGEVDNKG